MSSDLRLSKQGKLEERPRAFKHMHMRTHMCTHMHMHMRVTHTRSPIPLHTWS